MSCSKQCIEPYGGRYHRRPHFRHDWRRPYPDPVIVQQPVYVPQPAAPIAPTAPVSDMNATLNNPAVLIGSFCCFTLVAIIAILYFGKKM